MTNCMWRARSSRRRSSWGLIYGGITPSRYERSCIGGSCIGNRGAIEVIFANIFDPRELGGAYSYGHHHVHQIEGTTYKSYCCQKYHCILVGTGNMELGTMPRTLSGESTRSDVYPCDFVWNELIRKHRKTKVFEKVIRSIEHLRTPSNIVSTVTWISSFW